MLPNYLINTVNTCLLKMLDQWLIITMYARDFRLLIILEQKTQIQDIEEDRPDTQGCRISKILL